MQIFTYVVIGLGFTLFFSGLIGWVGGASESPCLVRLFLFSVVVSMVAEIGGIISLNIVRLQVCILTYLGTIHILRQHNFGLFLTHPPAHYVSINKVLNFSKSGHFLYPPTKSFWWRNIWMVSYVIRREIECVMLHIMLSSAGLWDFKNKRTRGELDVDILFTWHLRRQISLFTRGARNWKKCFVATLPLHNA